MSMAGQEPRIQLEIQGLPEQCGLVRLQTLALATQALTGLLLQVTADQPERVNVDWLVSRLQTGSVFLEVEGRAAAANRHDAVRNILQTIAKALAALETGEDVRGLLSYPALEQIGLLARLRGAATIIVRGFDQEIPMTTETGERVQALLARRFYSIGSIEGIVETVSMHAPGPSFTIAHALDGYAVPCRWEGALMPQVTAALGARVRVIGTLARRVDGQVDSVEATEIQVLRHRHELPQVNEIRGILAAAEPPGDDQSGTHG